MNWQTTIRNLHKSDKSVVDKFAKALAPAAAEYLIANIAKYPTVLESVVKIDAATDEFAAALVTTGVGAQEANERARKESERLRSDIVSLLYDNAEFWNELIDSMADCLIDAKEIAEMLCDDIESIKAVKA